jgi:hypothetical protein
LATAASYKGVIKHFNNSTDQIKWYFDQLPALLDDFPYTVCLAYAFLKTEQAQNRALYCGVVKLHGAHGEVADNAINKQHLTRDGFLLLYNNVFGHAMSAGTSAKITQAEKIRDRVIHGKHVGDPEMRQAVLDVIEYAEALNGDLKATAGFEPFGDLRGFKGRGQSLEKSTTRWLLKGLGFAIA